MTSKATAILDEAYQRLHLTGPEFVGRCSPTATTRTMSRNWRTAWPTGLPAGSPSRAPALDRDLWASSATAAWDAAAALTASYASPGPTAREALPAAPGGPGA